MTGLDNRTRFSGPKSRKNYAGTSPVTKASGHSRVVLARFARNRRLADACDSHNGKVLGLGLDLTPNM
jgi:hypothetical protein